MTLDAQKSRSNTIIQFAHLSLCSPRGNMVKAVSDCYLHQMYDIKMKVKRLLDKISRKCYRMMPISESVQNHSLFGQDI